jgi:hypothetical protein
MQLRGGNCKGIGLQIILKFFLLLLKFGKDGDIVAGQISLDVGFDVL